MRVTYRSKDVKTYWEDRWADIPADEPMENANVYPLKYAQMTIHANDGPILEAGCGAGRILRFYHNQGYDITGMDYIDVAISKLREIDPSLKVEVGDITRLKYLDQSFKYVLAFGLYHNLNDGLSDAVMETFRVLKKGGVVCASFRADNIQTRLTDWLSENKAAHKSPATTSRAFHKMNLTKSEYAMLFRKAGFKIETVMPVENMPILYKFSLFRAHGHKRFDESKGRTEGYKLSALGECLQKLLMGLFPNQFCNIYVLVGRRPI
jgi:SAM-dependent methyltransferase